jgi:hypothetical protein
MRAASVELVADNRTLEILAPARWHGVELSLLVARAGAILDLLHDESDARMGLVSSGGTLSDI